MTEQEKAKLINQIEDEVSIYLINLENMEDRQIITRVQRNDLKTHVKSWAYDEIKKVQNL